MTGLIGDLVVLLTDTVVVQPTGTELGKLTDVQKRRDMKCGIRE